MYMRVIQGDVQQNKKFKVKMLQGYSYICHRCIISENTLNITIIEIYTISTFYMNLNLYIINYNLFF